MSLSMQVRRLEIIGPFLAAAEKDTCEAFIQACKAGIARADMTGLSSRTAAAVAEDNKVLNNSAHHFYMGVYANNTEAREAIQAHYAELSAR